MSSFFGVTFHESSLKKKSNVKVFKKKLLVIKQKYL